MGPLSSWFNQLEWLQDERENVACACLRLEHLDKDLPAFLQRPVALRRANATRTTYDYRSMYTDELAAIVERLFRDDIEHFGFTFDGSATRNVFVLD
jgi:hypothetical protein